MITDQTIINLFFSKKGNRTNRYQKIIDNNLEIKSYLDSRYSDCIDYNEILWRIKLGYENVPICPVCGEHHVRFLVQHRGDILLRVQNSVEIFYGIRNKLM